MEEMADAKCPLIFFTRLRLGLENTHVSDQSLSLRAGPNTHLEGVAAAAVSMPGLFMG